MSEKNRTPNQCKNTIIIIAHPLPSVNLFQDLKVVADAGVEKSRKLSERIGTNPECRRDMGLDKTKKSAYADITK